MSQWTVRDVMTEDVVAVLADTPYREVVNLLQEGGFSAAPVVDEDRHVIGVVSEADLLHKVEFVGDERERRVFDRPSRRSARRKARAEIAGELMSAPPVTVTEDTSVVAAARLMETERVKRLPVVSGDGTLVGILSRADLLRMHLRPDPDIRAEVVDAVLRRVLWIDPLTVAVEVTEGVVSLRGRVDRRTTAHLAKHLVEQVAGVTAVVDELAWEFDDSVAARPPRLT